jgi:hypothetical protein
MSVLQAYIGGRNARVKKNAMAAMAGQGGQTSAMGAYTPSDGSPFRAALRMSESGGNHSIVNSEGYGGLYQWGQPRLDDYNRATGQGVTMEQFLSDPALQEQAQSWHEQDILGDLGPYVGTVVNGIVMDEAALIGMAHLGGTAGARKFIETGGRYDPADSNGTNLSDYARKFAGKAVNPMATYAGM